MTMVKHRTSLFVILLLGLIALMGFQSCTKPDELTDDSTLPRDTIPDIRLKYGVPPSQYIKGL